MVAERWEVEDAETLVLAGWATVIGRLYDRIAHRFGGAEVRARMQRYLSGLLAPVARKNGWQLAEGLGEEGPYGVQRLLDSAVWDAEAVRDDLRAYVIDYLGDGASGVLLVDETSFPKKGRQSCGVAPQYCGTVGRTTNCQVGVFLGYASTLGMAFLDRALYLPRCWTNDRGRCARAGVPAHVRFATKGALAKRLLARAFAARVPARWVVADSLYGRAHHVRRWLEGQKRSYVLGVLPGQVVEHGGRRLRAKVVVAALPPQAWVRQSSGAGCQGERVHDWACIPLSEAAPHGWARWLLVRRSVTTPSECAYFRAFGPATTAPPELVRVAGLRWAIEEGFAQAKGEVGLDQYEVRGWKAWHRQITLCLLAHAALAVTCALARHAETDPTLLPLTVPEVRRLVLTLDEDPAQQAFRLRWSRWRRTHQAGAQRCHIAHRRRELIALPPAEPRLSRSMASVDGGLTEAEWERVRPLLPPQKPAVGRPCHDHRTILSGILWVLRTAAPWREMPAEFGKPNTAFVRYRLWRRQGLWQRIIEALGPAESPPAPVARAPASQVRL